MSGDSEWRWADPSGQQRLVRTDELRAALASGLLAPNTPVWRSGWKEWRVATEVPELTSSALAAANGVVPNIPPPPLAVVAAQHAFEGEPVPDAGKHGSEPPPPPRYVPAVVARPVHVQTTPAQPMRVPVSATATVAGGFYVPTDRNVVPIRALREGDAAAIIAQAPPSPSAKIVDTAPPSRPPPPVKAVDGHPPPSKPPPPVKAVEVPPPPPSKPALTKAVTPSKPPAPPRPTHSEDERVTIPHPPTRAEIASAHERETVPNANARIRTELGLSALVRSPGTPPPPSVSSRPPPPPQRMSSKPPPPPPKTPSKAPPPVAEAKSDVIEELSGSVLLPEQSGAVRAEVVEELSGSILLPDQSGSVVTEIRRDKPTTGRSLIPDLSGPNPVAAPPPRSDELSANFLLDAGSTGALPSVESTGRILAAKAASRAPFAPLPEPGPRMEHPPRSSSLPPIMPLSAPLGSTPPPPPAALVAPAPVQVVGQVPAPTDSDLAVTRHMPAANASVEPPPVGAEPVALPTLVGVPPPPDHVLQQLQNASQGPTAPQETWRGQEALPPLERSSARLHDFRAMGHDPRARYVLAAFGLFGLVAVLGLIGLIVGAFRKKPSEEPVPTVVASASASPKAIAAAAAAPAAAPETPPLPTLGAPCTLSGPAHVVAPRAVVQSGVEVDVVGSRLAVGFAARDHEGFAVALDPSTLVATQTVRAHVGDPIRRIVPIPGPKGLLAAADVDHPADFLGGRRTIGATRPFDLGFGGGGLAWAPYRSSEVDMIWTLDGSDPVEAVRAAPLEVTREEAGWAIAFRRGAAIYAGVVTGGASLAPKGPLVKVAGLGPQVGSPTVAAQDGAVLVAWADRGQPSEPWSLRWMRFSPGDASADAKAFVPSEGGLGENAMSPSLSAAGQGRFVLAWTEGPVSNHQVRAQTINGSGAPLGNAMAISDSGVNAGQAQLALLPEGRGVVAYLASAASGPKGAYEVLATPIVCP